MNDHCPCSQCAEARRRAAGGVCYACHGRGTVLSASGAPRPCSRCRVNQFHEWSAASRAEAAASRARGQ